MLGLIDLRQEHVYRHRRLQRHGHLIVGPVPHADPVQPQQFFHEHHDRRKQERVTTCHSCHGAGELSEKKTMILAFVPLEMAPWGISIQEPEEDVFAPAHKLKRTFGDPCRHLHRDGVHSDDRHQPQHREPAEGADPRRPTASPRETCPNPIPPQGSDEIGVLSQSFETMRRRLVESMESITRHSQELETTGRGTDAPDQRKPEDGPRSCSRK